MKYALRHRFVPMILTFVLVTSLSSCMEQGPPGLSAGNKAPEITGQDVSGGPITLSQFHGKVVLLDFWATWCPPCVGEIPHELDLHRQFAGRPFVILGISKDRTREKLQQFLSQEKLPWPNIFDASGNISDQWKVQGIPTFVLIDHTGVIRKRWVGGGQSEQIRAAVDQAVRAAEGK